MDGLPVPKRNNPQSATTQFRQYSPEADTIIPLLFHANRIADNSHTKLT
jgi:hypothetical protein